VVEMSKYDREVVQDSHVMSRELSGTTFGDRRGWMFFFFFKQKTAYEI